MAAYLLLNLLSILLPDTLCLQLRICPVPAADDPAVANPVPAAQLTWWLIPLCDCLMLHYQRTQQLALSS
jgi:hypothetical protein